MTTFSLRKELAKRSNPNVEISQNETAFINEALRIAKSRHSIETKCGLLSNLAETTENPDLAKTCKELADVVAAQRPDLLKNDSGYGYLRVTRDDLERIEAAIKGQPIPEGVLLNKALSRAMNERRTK